MRYKKIILRHRFLLTNQGKLFKRHTLIWVLFMYLDLIFFVKSLPWPLDIHGSKLSFYRNIFLSQYHVQKYLVYRPWLLIFRIERLHLWWGTCCFAPSTWPRVASIWRATISFTEILLQETVCSQGNYVVSFLLNNQ